MKCAIVVQCTVADEAEAQGVARAIDGWLASFDSPITDSIALSVNLAKDDEHLTRLVWDGFVAGFPASRTPKLAPNFDATTAAAAHE
jgi:hypothetical protein